MFSRQGRRITCAKAVMAIGLIGLSFCLGQFAQAVENCSINPTCAELVTWRKKSPLGEFTCFKATNRPLPLRPADTNPANKLCCATNADPRQCWPATQTAQQFTVFVDRCNCMNGGQVCDLNQVPPCPDDHVQPFSIVATTCEPFDNYVRNWTCWDPAGT